MAVKTRSKTSARLASAHVAPAQFSFPRLAYSAPSPEESIGAQVRRFTLPATKSLPFVRLRANDQPLTRPESYWHVRPSGKTRHDREVGRQYARAAIAAMKTDQDGSLVAHILQDVITDAVARNVRKTGNRRNAITQGFLSEISLALAATP